MFRFSLSREVLINIEKKEKESDAVSIYKHPLPQKSLINYGNHPSNVTVNDTTKNDFNAIPVAAGL